jgi:hypothetical protein
VVVGGKKASAIKYPHKMKWVRKGQKGVIKSSRKTFAGNKMSVKKKKRF